MGMTMTQKILAHHAGLAKVEAGQLISAKLDIVLGNDITTPVAVNEFKKAGFFIEFIFVFAAFRNFDECNEILGFYTFRGKVMPNVHMFILLFKKLFAVCFF